MHSDHDTHNEHTVRDPHTHRFDPTRYDESVRLKFPEYDVFQRRMAEIALAETGANRSPRILDLGIGTGATTQAVIAAIPTAHVIGIDNEPLMLAAARKRFSEDRVTLTEGSLNAELPDDEFDIVVSSLAIHHISDDDKFALYRRIQHALKSGGTFVYGDLYIPEEWNERDDPSWDPITDTPSTITMMIDCLSAAGLSASVDSKWRFSESDISPHGDVCILVARKA